MKLKQILYYSALLFFLCCILQITSAECAFYVYSSEDLPVENVELLLRNLSDNSTLWMNSTDVNGFAFHSGFCGNSSIKIDYPASGYSAILTNTSVCSVAHINGWVTAQTQLKNTLGSYLEGQDCSVVVYGANTSIIIHDYDTMCRPGEPYIDRNGNWVGVTDRCTLTDSQGWYYFKGRIDEGMGFEYAKSYDLVFTCNGQSESVNFTTILERQPDIEKVEDFTRFYSGIILLFIVSGLGITFVLIFLFVVIKILQSRQSRSSSKFPR